MGLYSDPPSLLPFRHDKPTLLVCWWTTAVCAMMILLRVCGRFIRTERLFREDRIAALAVVPLILRMVCVHFILLHGTNNADFSGQQLSDIEIDHKAAASGLVLASRFLNAATLWTLKLAVLEFLRRLAELTWARSHRLALRAIRWTLLVTFLAVVISDLTECQPFSNYWQVLPDPGGQCRQGYAQLLTMAVCNIFTDVLLVTFPIPIIVGSRLPIQRKLHLIVLFSLNLSVVVVTIYRLPRVFEEQGRQQYRSLMASVELLFATAAANALVLGSFVRDRGVKKQKFRRASAVESFDRPSNARRPTLQRLWGSDEDLVRDVGLSVNAASRRGHQPDTLEDGLGSPDLLLPLQGTRDQRWHNPKRGRGRQLSDDFTQFRYSLARHKSPPFRDIGVLSEISFESAGKSGGSSGRRGSCSSSTIEPNADYTFPPASALAEPRGMQRGSKALLQDLGGFLRSDHGGKARPTRNPDETELQAMPRSRAGRPADGQKDAHLELMDAGGLLEGG